MMKKLLLTLTLCLLFVMFLWSLLPGWYLFVRYMPRWVPDKVYTTTVGLLETPWFNTLYKKYFLSTYGRANPDSIMNIVTPINQHPRPNYLEIGEEELVMADVTIREIKEEEALGEYTITAETKGGDSLTLKYLPRTKFLTTAKFNTQTSTFVYMPGQVTDNLWNFSAADVYRAMYAPEADNSLYVIIKHPEPVLL